MCGLAGLIGKGMIDKDVEAFQELLYFMAVRGPHSTGLMTYTPTGLWKKPAIRLSKSVGSSAAFIYADNMKKIEDRMIRTHWTEIFMAHCRYATVGAVTKENAHPFDTGNLISAHNGTLWSSRYDDKIKTDSQMLFEDIEKRGVKAVLSELEPRDAYAVSVFNKSTKKLTLARNEERTLYVGISGKRDVLYWSSDADMLRCISNRHKLDLTVLYLEPHHAYEIDLNKVKAKNETPWKAEVWDAPVYKSTIITGPSTQSMLAGLPWYDNSTTGKNITAWDSEWCCTCGEEIFGRHLTTAKCTVVDRERYYTCETCTKGIEQSRFRQDRHRGQEVKIEQEKEVKVG